MDFQVRGLCKVLLTFHSNNLYLVRGGIPVTVEPQAL